MSPQDLLRSIDLDASAPAPSGAILQDFTPLHGSVDALITQAYWTRQGLAPFVRDEMPYVINNSGWAPQAAANVLYDGLAALDEMQDLVVIEVASGLGLFARQVLDAVKARDSQDNGSVYRRLTYVVTDGSTETVAAWNRSGQFAEHSEHVVVGVCDALEMVVRNLSGDVVPIGSAHAIVANYALDALPATVVKLVDGDLYELMVRTRLPCQNEEVASRFGSTLGELQATLSTVSEIPETLISVAPHLAVEAEFRPASSDITPWALTVADAFPDNVAVSVNFGALDFLRLAASRLAPGGMILLSDYGPTSIAEFNALAFTHRFGHMTTNSINFPFIDRYFQNSDYDIYTARDDEKRSIHVRLIVRTDAPSNGWQTFLSTMGDASYVDGDRRHLVATEHITHGRYEAALATFARGLEICPSDWYLLASAAQFLCQQLGRNEDALELAQRAAEINPWHSALVFNTLGNAHYRLGRFDAAADAFERAFAIEPTDPQTLLNRAFILDARGDEAGALAAIADGLCNDTQGRFQNSLLGKQAAIIAARAARFASASATSQARERALRKAEIGQA